jgi:hypothetical protein
MLSKWRHAGSPPLRSNTHKAFGIVTGSPLSLPKTAGRNPEVGGQSVPLLSGVASIPAPYSPVSKYVRDCQP